MHITSLKNTLNATHCFGYSSPTHLFQIENRQESEAQRETRIR